MPRIQTCFEATVLPVHCIFRAGGASCGGASASGRCQILDMAVPAIRRNLGKAAEMAVKCFCRGHTKEAIVGLEHLIILLLNFRFLVDCRACNGNGKRNVLHFHG